MVALMLSGILKPAEAVAGFANPAVITVGAMFLISRAMVRTGAVGFIARRVIAYSGGRAWLAMLVILLTVAVASAFINNTPVVVLFIPIILSLSCEYGFSPSKYLIPVSYASILAGTCTLIGTSTNIIVSDLSLAYGHGAIGMFELSPVGVPIAVAGIVLLFGLSSWLMPSHATPTCEWEDREDRRYLAELQVTSGSGLIGQEARGALTAKYPSFELFEVIRRSHILFPDEQQITISPADLLLVKGSANDLIAILHERLVKLPLSEEGFDFGGGGESLIVELIIPPQSKMVGQRLVDTLLVREPAVQTIAIKRRRIHYTEQKIRRVHLQTGDIILVRCSRMRLEQLRGESDVIIIEDIHHEIVHKQKARWALLIFAGIITAAASGLAEIMMCALAGAFLMILTGCLQMRDAYRSIQGNVLLLIVGTIALGAAMQKTGASQLYANAFLSVLKGLSPGLVLGGIILLTSISTQLLSNNATAVLLLPIAISTAQGLGVDPRPFIIAVCFGASACFASPIGYQTNLLVYGPGSYRFGDYIKLGIPLNLLVILMAAWLIPLCWPLRPI